MQRIRHRCDAFHDKDIDFEDEEPLEDPSDQEESDDLDDFNLTEIYQSCASASLSTKLLNIAEEEIETELEIGASDDKEEW